MNNYDVFTLFSKSLPYTPRDGIETWSLIYEPNAFYFKSSGGKILNRFVYHTNWSTKLQALFPFPVCATELIRTHENEREYYVLFYKDETLVAFEMETDDQQDFYYRITKHTDGYWKTAYYEANSLSIGKAFVSLLAHEKEYRLQAATGNWTFYTSDNRFVPCDYLNGNPYEENVGLTQRECEH